MLGERRIQVPFLVVDDLKVPVLLGSLSIHQHVRSLLPPERLIVLWDDIDEKSSKTLPFVENAGKVKKNHYFLRSANNFIVQAMK